MQVQCFQCSDYRSQRVSIAVSAKALMDAFGRETPRLVSASETEHQTGVASGSFHWGWGGSDRSICPRRPIRRKAPRCHQKLLRLHEGLCELFHSWPALVKKESPCFPRSTVFYRKAPDDVILGRALLCVSPSCVVAPMMAQV